MRRLAFVVFVACGACGGGPTPPPPRPPGPPAAFVEAAPPGDVQVATVNGQPVWGSCVTAQAARGESRDQALKDCVDFELLAQAAQARGLATDPEVELETRTALVSQLVAKEFEDKFQSPADFGALWKPVHDRNSVRYDHDEYRGSVYVRVNLPKVTTPADDAAAHAIADEIATKLSTERGLSEPQFVALAQSIAGSRVQLAHEAVPPYQRDSKLHESYSYPLFDIPEVGRTSPAVRTPWGWDVILFAEDVPAVHPGEAEVTRQLLPEMKRSYFVFWTNQIAKQLGVKIKVEDANLPLLENL